MTLIFTLIGQMRWPSDVDPFCHFQANRGIPRVWVCDSWILPGLSMISRAAYL